MSGDAFTPITGVEDNPLDSGFIDEANEQSIDLLLLDPERQSVPAEKDPAALNPLGQLDDIRQRVRQLVKDPVALRAAEIHEEIQQILRMQRDICDGIELATDQVQDKRIEFLEAGPEVAVSSFFVEFALLFFVNSPLLGAALSRSFRFIGARILANRAARLERLEKAAQETTAKVSQITEEMRKNGEALLENQRALQAAGRATRHNLVHKRSELNATRRSVEEKANALRRIADRSTDAQSQGKVTEAALKEFFKEANENFAKDYGIALVKGAVGPALRAGREGGSDVVGAADSIGVQIKARAQFQLRNVEMHLGLVAADADLLRSVAQADPFLGPHCFAILTEMLAGLRGAKASTAKPPLDMRRRAMLEFEKLIWVLLMPDSTLNRPEQIEQLQKEADEMPFQDPFLDSFGLALSGVAPFIGQPSPRFMAYLNDRFFADKDLSTDEMLKELKRVKQEFLQKAAGEPPMEIISVRFKKEKLADTGEPAPQVPAP